MRMQTFNSPRAYVSQLRGHDPDVAMRRIIEKGEHPELGRMATQLINSGEDCRVVSASPERRKDIHMSEETSGPPSTQPDRKPRRKAKRRPRPVKPVSYEPITPVLDRIEAGAVTEAAERHAKVVRESKAKLLAEIDKYIAEHS